MRRVSRKGISPVIATVILVAVTITIALSIAYWMGGIAGLYTRFEKVEIVYANAERDDSGWKITLKVRNTGSASTTIDEILLNGVPISVTDDAECTYKYDTSTSEKQGPPILLNSGDEVTITITLSDGAQMGSSKATSGLSVEVKLHTSGGKDYPVLVTLP